MEVITHNIYNPFVFIKTISWLRVSKYIIKCLVKMFLNVSYSKSEEFSFIDIEELVESKK